MTIRSHIRPTSDSPVRSRVPDPVVSTTVTHKAVAVLRISTGFVFLWAFLDKTFGLGYSTPSAGAWIHGGSPTLGFLKSVDVGPFQSAFHSMAGAWWVDGLFMMAMLGVGVALILGVAIRPAAVVGILVLAMMWLAELPLARHTSGGALTGSTNPVTDYHFIYAAVLAVLACSSSAHTWSLGRRWAELPFVGRHGWTR
ncbi:DoxX family membrane protein [Leekyejoonella antrihumi]|uniref:DoxX family membrane protein n=1 Tax=Leekyejoonella antrihumi TaxID=1660198 RepID=A0A563E0A9_9MICO|nr:DoxX family membrane protein [Leekyejoonella antrihumi]TWP35825.1 DoxX family membrane protein [Leekyejoonella antrihumi]